MLNGGWRIPDRQLVKLVLSQGGGGTWRAEKMWVVLGGAYLLPSAYYLPCLEVLLLLPSLTHSFKCCNIDNRASDMHCRVLCFHSVVVS